MRLQALFRLIAPRSWSLKALIWQSQYISSNFPAEKAIFIQLPSIHEQLTSETTPTSSAQHLIALADANTCLFERIVRASGLLFSQAILSVSRGHHRRRLLNTKLRIVLGGSRRTHELLNCLLTRWVPLLFEQKRQDYDQKTKFVRHYLLDFASIPCCLIPSGHHC